MRWLDGRTVQQPADPEEVATELQVGTPVSEMRDQYRKYEVPKENEAWNQLLWGTRL